MRQADSEGQELVGRTRRRHHRRAFQRPLQEQSDRLLADTPGSRLMNDTAFFQPGNGKLTFRSHLTVSERAAVKKVASGNFGVSERFI